MPSTATVPSPAATVPSTQAGTPRPVEQPYGALRVGGGDHGNHADAHVQGALGLLDRHAADIPDQTEDRCGRPRRPVDGRRQVGRQDAGQVGRQPAARDVAERVHLDALDQRQTVARVDAGRLEQLVDQRATELGHRRSRCQPAVVSSTCRTSE